jgi:hypothetical protein
MQVGLSGGADAQLPRERGPAGCLAGGWSDGAVHRRVRGRRIRDPARSLGLARAPFWALIGLIVFGVVTIFVQIPNGALSYAILGLVIFAGLTAFDFQRLRRNQDIRTAPLLAASISSTSSTCSCCCCRSSAAERARWHSCAGSCDRPSRCPGSIHRPRRPDASGGGPGHQRSTRRRSRLALRPVQERPEECSHDPAAPADRAVRSASEAGRAGHRARLPALSAVPDRAPL